MLRNRKNQQLAFLIGAFLVLSGPISGLELITLAEGKSGSIEARIRWEFVNQVWEQRCRTRAPGQELPSKPLIITATPPGSKKVISTAAQKIPPQFPLTIWGRSYLLQPQNSTLQTYLTIPSEKLQWQFPHDRRIRTTILSPALDLGTFVVPFSSEGLLTDAPFVSDPHTEVYQPKPGEGTHENSPSLLKDKDQYRNIFPIATIRLVAAIWAILDSDWTTAHLLLKEIHGDPRDLPYSAELEAQRLYGLTKLMLHEKGGLQVLLLARSRNQYSLISTNLAILALLTELEDAQLNGNLSGKKDLSSAISVLLRESRAVLADHYSSMVQEYLRSIEPAVPAVSPNTNAGGSGCVGSGRRGGCCASCGYNYTVCGAAVSCDNDYY